MASIDRRGDSWRVRWRLAGTPEIASFKSEDTAKQAKGIAEAHHHNVDKWFVYNAVLGTPIPTKVDAAAPLTPTLREWAAVYLTAKTRLSPDTKARYRQQLNTVILPRLGDLRLDEIEGTHVSALLTELRSCDCASGTKGPRCASSRSGHGLDDRTVTRYYSILHAVLGYAVLERKIRDNPAKRTDWVRDMIAHDDAEEEGADHVYLTSAEYYMIRANIDADARPLLDYLVGTGARWGEATAAQVRSIDAMANPPIAKIHRAWKRHPASEQTSEQEERWYVGSTKGRSRRTLDIPSTLVDVLVPRIASDPGDSLLFSAPGGGRLDYSNFAARRWNPAVIMAMRCSVHPPRPEGTLTNKDELRGPRCRDNGGVRGNGTPCGAVVTRGWDRCKDHVAPSRHAVSTCGCPTVLRKRPTIHDLRHTHASWLIAVRPALPLIAISRRLGHHSITITERVYAGILPQVNASLVDGLATFMRPDTEAVSDAGARS